MEFLTPQELVVVANNSFSDENISVETIRSIFLDKRRFIEKKKVLVMNLEVHHPLRLCFEKKVLEKSERSLERYWRKAYYLGKRPPKVIKSVPTLFSYLDNVAPSIGYSDANESIGKKVKILYKVECND